MGYNAGRTPLRSTWTASIDRLRSRALTRGVVLPDQPIVDGAWHESEIVGAEGGRHGRYLLFPGPPPLALCQSMIDGGEPDVWYAIERPLTMRQQHMVAAAVARLRPSVRRAQTVPVDTKGIASVEQRRGGAVKAAQLLLMKLLAHGDLETNAIRRQAQASGIAWGSVRRASEALRIETFRRGYGRGGRWYWRLGTAPAETLGSPVEAPIEERI